MTPSTQERLKLKSGDRVRYEYIHNRRETVSTVWEGVFIGLIRHTKRYQGPQIAMVQFDYREKPSRLPMHKLVKL